MFVLLEDVADFSVRQGPRARYAKKILRHLMDNGGWVLRCEIEDLLWGDREDGGPDNTQDGVDVVIWKLRGRLHVGFSIESRGSRGCRLVVVASR